MDSWIKSWRLSGSGIISRTLEEIPKWYNVLQEYDKAEANDKRRLKNKPLKSHNLFKVCPSHVFSVQTRSITHCKTDFYIATLNYTSILSKRCCTLASCFPNDRTFLQCEFHVEARAAISFFSSNPMTFLEISGMSEALFKGLASLCLINHKRLNQKAIPH